MFEKNIVAGQAACGIGQQEQEMKILSKSSVSCGLWAGGSHEQSIKPASSEPIAAHSDPDFARCSSDPACDQTERKAQERLSGIEIGKLVRVIGRSVVRDYLLSDRLKVLNIELDLLSFFEIQ